jgi:hypothetical protein
MVQTTLEIVAFLKSRQGIMVCARVYFKLNRLIQLNITRSNVRISFRTSQSNGCSKLPALKL